jgi:cation:H+ antiporter
LSAWFEFLACAAVIGVAGFELARYADAVAERTRLGGTWVGMVLLATVTSLPELVTAISAVTAAEAPDITIGDVLGSCVLNLAILAAAEFFLRGEPIFVKASQTHIISGAFGVILLAVVAMDLANPDVAKFSIGHVGLDSLVIVVLYTVSARTVFIHESRVAERQAAGTTRTSQGG